MRILVLDNHDSFVYNLVHYIEEISNQKVTVIKNNEISLDEVDAFDKILLSPGPGLPSNAGMMPQIIETYFHQKNIFGVCLGHQALGEFFGYKLQQLSNPMHGIATTIQCNESSLLFKNMPHTFDVGHYHSWVISGNQPSEMQVTAVDSQGHIMAIEHPELPLFGVQFHPESILTAHGKKIISNWLAL